MPMTLSGDGTITGLVAGGLPNATIQQADLASNVAGTGPTFSASLGTNQSITSSVITKVTFDVENFDTNSNFASSRFTPTIAGYYLLTAGVDISTTANIVRFLIQFFKNGSAFSTPQDFAAIALRTNASQLMYLNGTTDYVEVYAYVGGTTPVLTAGQTTSFSGYLVRGV